MTIRISNLSDNTTKEDILLLLRKYGGLANLRLIPDRYSVEDLVIVYAEFMDAEKGAKALKELNGLEINGEKIVVKEVENA
tara:strand:- start:805 stop:1047 length:243 start_codon:yes stop_codon:yes gene_type:complete